MISRLFQSVISKFTKTRPSPKLHRLYVHNVDANLKASDLAELFIERGVGFDRIEIIRFKNNRDKVYGLVTFTDVSQLRECMTMWSHQCDLLKFNAIRLTRLSPKRKFKNNPLSYRSVNSTTKSTSPKNHNLYVSGLNKRTKASDLKAHLSKYVGVNKVKIIEFHKARGMYFGLVSFDSALQKDKCAKWANETNFNGNFIRLSQNSPF